MRWNPDDIESFIEAKEYIDTVIIPVHTLRLQEMNKEQVQKIRKLEDICLYIENQLKGRVLLLPPVFQYLASNSEDYAEVFQRFLVHSVQDGGDAFKHMLFVTEDDELAAGMKEHGAAVFHDFSLGEIEDRDGLMETGNRGYQFLLNLWKG
ncbi:MAG: DUF2487 family protein [Bacillaceae bacterium]|nr:DUF2487 family protein [Bacillaceae bacterium]